MRVQTAKPLRTISLVVFVLAVFFFAFVDTSKHIPFLAMINPFADDPYDAVGSFGIQLSLFAALLSLLRAFRPYPTKEIPSNQCLLILRVETVALLAIFVTLIADSAALFRYVSMWQSSPAGWVLAGLVGGLMLLTLLVSMQLYRIAGKLLFSFPNRSWIQVLLFPLCILILAVYPANLLESIPGGIFSALLGMIILFLSTWALATTIFPPTEINFEDVFDDLAAIYKKIKSRAQFISPLESLAKADWLGNLFHWLNPRKHKWNLVILIGLLMGVSLMLVEAFQEGVSSSSSVVLLVFGVFVGIEGAGIVLGYILFSRFLGIFREEKNTSPKL